MPEKDRIERLEETAVLLVEQARLSLQQAQIAEKRLGSAEKRLDSAENQMTALREALKETDARLGQRIEALVSTIGEYIRSDREQRGR
jgi:chromosome segregation ATPase